jgi:hypothetical protein
VRRTALVLAAAAVLASCQAVLAPAPTSPPPITTPTLTPTASVPTPTESATLAPTTATTTTAPTPTTQGTDPCASSTSDQPASPPAAQIEPADGGEPIAGRVGSFTYCDLAVDALPPRAESLTPVALGDPAHIVLSVPASGEGFISNRAGYWPASEWQGDEVVLTSDATAAPLTTTEFAGPPTGDWMLAIHLIFASGGSALYYWHVTVP